MSIQGYVNQVNQCAQNINQDFQNALQAHAEGNTQLEKAALNAANDNYNQMKQVLDEAKGMCAQMNTPAGKKAYDAFNKALGELSSKSIDAPNMVNVFHAVEDAQGAL